MTVFELIEALQRFPGHYTAMMIVPGAKITIPADADYTETLNFGTVPEVESTDDNLDCGACMCGCNASEWHEIDEVGLESPVGNLGPIVKLMTGNAS